MSEQLLTRGPTRGVKMAYKITESTNSSCTKSPFTVAYVFVICVYFKNEKKTNKALTSSMYCQSILLPSH